MSTSTVPEDNLDAPIDAPVGATATEKSDRARSARVLRTVWRIHFYAAFIAVPFLLMQILTGLVIMYGHPIQSVMYGDVMRVDAQGQTVSLQVQREAADAAAPEGSTLASVVTPLQRGDATAFQYPRADGKTLDVFVNPYTGEVTGTHVNGQDLVGLANRLHGYLNAENVTIKLPSLAHLVDPDSGEFIQDYKVGDLVLEIAAGWTLALTIAGLFLWWPRKTQKGKALLVPRKGKKGLLRWRDLHAASGILAVGALLLFLVTGLPWSGYWGPTWSAAAGKITEGAGPFAAGASSTPATVGELDRYGTLIPWAMQEAPVPSSGSGHEGHSEGDSSMEGMAGMEGMDGMAPGAMDADGHMAAPAGLDVVEKAARDEGIDAGYTVYLPSNETAEDGTTTYGSYTLTNYWPSTLSNERTVVLDQFSAKTLVVSTSKDYGALQGATEAGIVTHMGTQFGLVNKIWITASCVLLLFAIYSSFVMWWKRRPTGGLGLPRRPATPAFTASIIGVTVALMVIYPLWGVTALIVLGVDKFVVRRVPRLRRFFGAPA